MGKTKYLSVFEQGMVVGDRLASFCQILQRCWVFQAQLFPFCIKNCPPPNVHPANLTQLWELQHKQQQSYTRDKQTYSQVELLG